MADGDPQRGEFPTLDALGDAVVRAAERSPAQHRWSPRRASFALASLAIGVGAAAALLRGAAASPDLAERAYAAASKPGIVHWRTEIAGYLDGEVKTRQRIEGWSQGRIVHTLHSDVIHGKAHVTVDERVDGRRSRAWMSGTDDWHTAVRDPGRAILSPIPNGDPLAAFRHAYRTGRLRDLGGGRFALRERERVASGSIVYEVDPRTARPLRITIDNRGQCLGCRNAVRSTTVVRFAVYEVLPDTADNRTLLELLPHPGAGPGREPASRYFAALRTGARPTGETARRLRGLARAMSRGGGRGDRFEIDADGIRSVASDVWLMPADGYLCMAVEGSPPTGHGVGLGLGGTCTTVRKAARSGIGTATTIVVPDGTRAFEARYRWHGPWKRIAVVDGVARLPGLGYQTRLVR